MPPCSEREAPVRVASLSRSRQISLNPPIRAVASREDFDPRRGVLQAGTREGSEPPYPNRTALGVNWLAGFDFEIKVIARIPGDASNPPARS
jgi:hypothetical protein